MKQTILLISLFVCLICSPLFANVTLYTSRTDFNAEGTIVYNYGFEDFPTNGAFFPGDPFTRDGVTYTTGSNLIIGSDTYYHPLSNVLVYNYFTPITADIDTSAQYSMFGFDLGYLDISKRPDLEIPIDLEISTNLDTYSFLNLDVPIFSEGMNFYGFTAGPGEYFTGLTLNAPDGVSLTAGPAIDNTTVGYLPVSIVPVPSSLLLAGIGVLSGLKLFRKK